MKSKGRPKKDKVQVMLSIDREIKAKLDSLPNIENSSLVNGLLIEYFKSEITSKVEQEMESLKEMVTQLSKVVLESNSSKDKIDWLYEQQNPDNSKITSPPNLSKEAYAAIPTHYGGTLGVDGKPMKKNSNK